MTEKIKDVKVYIKFVKRANMWLRTTINFNEKGEKQQKQEWFTEQPKVI